MKKGATSSKWTNYLASLLMGVTATFSSSSYALKVAVPHGKVNYSRSSPQSENQRVGENQRQQGGVQNKSKFSNQISPSNRSGRATALPMSPSNSLLTKSQSAMRLSTMTPPSKEEPVGFSGKLSISSLQSVVDHQDGTKKDITQVVGIAGLDFTEYGSLELTMIYDRMNKDPKKSDFEDSEIRYSWKPYHLSISREWEVDFIPDIGVALPTSRESYENQEMQAAGIAEGSFSFTSKKSAIQQNYTMAIETYRYMHKYDVAIDGTSNVQWVLDQTLSAKWSYGKFSVFTSFIHFDTWTYSGNTDGLFRHKEGVGFALTKNIGFQAGHTNFANVFRANGYSNNVKLFDEESSLYFIKLVLSI